MDAVAELHPPPIDVTDALEASIPTSSAIAGSSFMAEVAKCRRRFDSMELHDKSKESRWLSDPCRHNPSHDHQGGCVMSVLHISPSIIYCKTRCLVIIRPSD